MSHPVTLLVGTTKGLFLLTADARRKDWTVSGPHCEGWPINHAAGDPETGALWAAGGSQFNGAGVWRSTDDGENWTLSKLADGQIDEWVRNDPETAKFMGVEPQDPAPFSGEVEAMWSLGRSNGTLYAGGKPGMLYASTDGGVSWSSVDGINKHPSRDNWMPGGAGLTLHSFVAAPDTPGKMWIAISSAGVLATEDSGETWDRRNRLSNAEACASHFHPAAPRGGETGHCVHNIVRAPGGGDLLYQQNHHGVFRSRDGGRNWDDITEGLPSTFGFPIAVHPTRPDTIWTVPLNGDMEGRFPPGASAAVWRSRDGGDSWQPTRNGLPQENCFFTVLRQAMTTDTITEAGLYFGTNTDSVYASTDEGDSWHEIAQHLPTVLCVECVTRV